MFADSGVVDFLHQLGVLVDQPGLPQHVGRRVFDLLPDDDTQTHKQMHIGEQQVALLQQICLSFALLY